MTGARLVAVGLALAIGPATAQPTAPAGGAAPPAVAAALAAPSKKARYLDDKLDSRAPAPRPGAPPPKLLNLHNTWTDEWLAIDADPRVAVPRAEMDLFLRDHYTDDPTAMDPRLVGVLREAARHFGATRIDIVSGYRAPKYNLMLRKKGHEVARDSQHTHGTAVDFRIPGVSVDELYAWAVARKLGGVGRYRGSKFVHMDTGRIRYWEGE
ncbi:MAG: DUF882 domain-containing protein [Kofleriaceae bacterium]|jgi:uncharacterized protein YcbK (DUF882 family)|nr:DUF882 domain-containing protein [Kofleriaceae bacterium]MBP9168998.1 DUF882 domain-containing protein [Kofleriaceae bacterium]MBP9858851.1 DUF882 domain-containing protein [Kofleriaceae bacterium]